MNSSQQIALDSIAVDEAYRLRGFDPVNDQQDAALLDDIRAVGVQMPLVVRATGENFVVMQGHRRLGAVKALNDAGAEIKTVSCIVEF